MKKVFLFFILLFAVQQSHAKDYELNSPTGINKLKISCADNLSFIVLNKGVEIVSVKDILLDIKELGKLGSKPVVLKAIATTGDATIHADIPVKFRLIRDHYQQLELVFKGNYSIVFRAYDNGIAYRFITKIKRDSIIVNNENFSFNISNAQNAWWPYEYSKHANPFASHFEYLFKEITYKDIDQVTVGLPIYLTAGNDSKIVFTESDLFDYPNLFVKKDGLISSTFPHPILEQEQVGDRGIKVIKQSDYIAKTKGIRTYPWRLWMIDPDDAGLLENTLVYQLATPSKIDASWVQPGKVAWDWWNDNNIYGVDFKSGINNETYKYYIDFAARYGLNYILLDEGWTKTTLDLLHSNAGINVPELVAYGKKKNVGVILWVLWNPLNDKMNEILDLYKSWGVKGIKVDFMQRAEQYMVNFYTRTAEACAQRNLMVDFHGAYKPTGLQRTYPNIMNFEGVAGMENNKWGDIITPRHDATLPFTRMMAGPMDYTPGAMRNGTKQNYRAVFSQPMSQGTRAHQTALYVIFEAPLQMFSDNPTNYMHDDIYTRYLAQFPTIWDETKPLYAQAGKAVVIARRNGDTWYLGGITNWDVFSKEFKLDFLNGGRYNMNLLEDGVNAYKMAEDYKISQREVTNNDIISVQMAPGGGFTAVFKPVK